MTDACRVALIGSGIKMSMARPFHEMAGSLAGIDLTYDLIERPPDSGADIPRLLQQCREDGYSALNITYPFKEVAFGCVDIDDPSVRLIGAVNTVVFDPSGTPVGSNTDFSGLLRRWALRFRDVDPGVVALIGAGGVGKSTAFALGELGASEIRVVDPDGARVSGLINSLASRFPGLAVSASDSAGAAVEGADGVVNATPIGMYFNPGSPVDLDAIGDQRWLFDVVYSPVDTPLVVRAGQAGLAVLNGFELFLGQGFEAFEAFTGRRLAPAAATRLEDEMWRKLAERAI